MDENRKRKLFKGKINRQLSAEDKHIHCNVQLSERDGEKKQIIGCLVCMHYTHIKDRNNND
jgi:hypothetical protein